MIDTNASNHKGRKSAMRMEMGKGVKRTVSMVEGEPGSGAEGEIKAALDEMLRTNKARDIFVAAGSTAENSFSHSLGLGGGGDWSKTFSRDEAKRIVTGELNVPELRL